MSLSHRISEGLGAWFRRHRTIIVVAVVFWGLGLYMGWGNGVRGPDDLPASTTQTVFTKRKTPKTVWTCSRHPQFKLPKKGKCPICRMDLLPIKDSGDAYGHNIRLAISEATRKLSAIQTSRVQRRPVSLSMRMMGRVGFDETRVKTITSGTPGRLERMFIGYTGVRVRRGEHLVRIHSPEKEKPQQRVNIYSPISGTVIHKKALEGTFAKTGTHLYTIADLSQVWIRFDAYERDLPFLFVEQKVTFSSLAAPGRSFAGKVLYIDPVLNTKTRTVGVRVKASNAKGLLKPGMFVRGTIHVSLGSDGRARAPNRTGKWVCSMHPQIIQSKRSKCSICGMSLVPVPSKKAHTHDRDPIVIPSTAPMYTGKRSVVYVNVPGAKKPTYEGRVIVVGSKAGPYIVVLQGLKVGDEVVSHGAFKLDSELQIRAQQSMMSLSGNVLTPKPKATVSRDGEPVKTFHRFLRSLSPVYKAYFSLQQALFNDQWKESVVAAKALQTSLLKRRQSMLTSLYRKRWQLLRNKLVMDSVNAVASKDIKAMRTAFDGLSSRLLRVVYVFGHVEKHSVFEAYCPMAFNKRGAVWLQPQDQEIRNSYFGAKMAHCGSVRREFPARLPQTASTKRSKK